MIFRVEVLIYQRVYFDEGLKSKMVIYKQLKWGRHGKILGKQQHDSGCPENGGLASKVCPSNKGIGDL